MQNVMSKIIEWGKELPYWEQVTLDKIINGEDFTEEGYAQILQLLLEDEGLADKKTSREFPRFYQQLISTAPASSPVRLKKITNLHNVNALVENQTLAFAPQLTAIFGENGSGKSGYARVLGSAGFTRGDREVLPDITKLKSGTDPMSVDIEISINGFDHPIHHKIGKPCPQLSTFYVFDSTSVRVHMSEKNEFSFSPAGLSYLKRLSDETDQIRSRLTSKVEEYCKLCEYAAFFPGDTEVSRLVVGLGPDTDLAKLKALATLSTEEKKRRNELAIEIANVELDKIKGQIAALKQRIEALTGFSAQLKQAGEQLSDTRYLNIRQSVQYYIQCQETANQAGIAQFRDDHFEAVGSPAWKRFIESARNWANESVKNTYPTEDDLCLLCRQPLTPQSRQLMVDMWKFLKGESQSALVESDRLLNIEKQTINNVSLFSVGTDHSLLYQIIGEYDAALFKKIADFNKAYRGRFDTIKQSLEVRQPVEFELTHSPDCVNELDALIERLKDNLKTLEDTNLEKTVRELENKKLELDHRVLLGPVYEKIKEYVEQRKWAQAAKNVGGNTRHITLKHNDLFKELVTDEYIKLFEETLHAMGRPLKVKIATPGQKGKTLKQIVLEAASDAKDARPEKVLSEGEKRAVALADFLTEVVLDSTSDGIILDDPVTSLDMEWRETVAEMLVKKATDHQVVIFTHDLPFLYYLKSIAEQLSIPISTHWIKRGEHDSRPGYVYLDNSPALEREYRKAGRSKDILVKARQADAALQEALLRDGFGALRTSYEAFIVFDIFEEVVMRFNERISFGRLRNICWDDTLAADVIESCERLSRYIEGHLHSDAFAGIKVKPDTLFQEIEHFEELQKKLKLLKKQASSS